MCDLDDLDPCEVYSETPRTARKAHRCSACRGPIRPGDRYLDHFDVFEGEAHSEKLCEPCRVARDEFTRAHATHGVGSPSTFVWLLQTCLDEDPDSRARWQPMLAAMRVRAAAP